MLSTSSEAAINHTLSALSESMEELSASNERGYLLLCIIRPTSSLGNKRQKIFENLNSR